MLSESEVGNERIQTRWLGEVRALPAAEDGSGGEVVGGA